MRKSILFDVLHEYIEGLDSTERQYHYFNCHDLGSGAGNVTLAAML